jgi:elongation factor Ts
MPDISAKLVMTFRDRYNLPMMSCKKALAAVQEGQTNDEAWIAAAFEWARKNQMVKESMLAKETTIGGLGMATGGTGALVLLACQTDFVSGNDLFKDFVKKLAETAAATGAETPEALGAAAFEGQTVTQAVAGKILQIGENLRITKVALLKGGVAGYNHNGVKAAIVSGSGDHQLLRKIAMHIVSSPIPPAALDRAGVDPELVKKEEEILLATPEVQGKPEAMRPKIVQGKLGRFFKEHVLLEQEMMLDAEKGETVGGYAKRHGLTVTGFIRLAV